MSQDWQTDLEELQRQIERLQADVRHAVRGGEALRVPSVAEFVLGSGFLAQSKIYPTQLTILRTIFCEEDHLTSHDLRKIEEFGSGFVRSETAPAGRWLFEPAPDRDFVMGTTPDLFDRMREMRRQGRRWFREPNLVWGRRAGKGHTAAITCAKVLWEVLALGDPQAHFGIPEGKRIQIQVFAGNLEQARFNLFGDIVATLVAAPCFAPYLVKLTRDRLIIATPADLARPDRPFDGSIEIVAKESTATAGRGPATIMQFYDEMAFVDPSTSRASAEVVYSSATPALDQFGHWAMVMELSSPHQQTGEFFEIHCRAREIDHVSSSAAYPEVFTLQLPSWAPYEDWGHAADLPVANELELANAPGLVSPDGGSIYFPPTGRPIVANDVQMRQLERARPREFRIERLAQWGTVGDPFLEPHQVDRVFAPHLDALLCVRESGILKKKYFVAVDPAATHDAFAWVIAHPEPIDEEGRVHVEVDLVRRWLPADHGGELNLTLVMDQLEADCRAFRPVDIVTDQYGGQFVRQDLNRRLFSQPLRGNSPVRKLDRTRQRNLGAATLFREALQLGQVHCYPHPQLERELRFLQETAGGVSGPSSGPVTTDDCAIALIIVVEQIIGEASGQPIFDALGATSLHGVRGHATPEDREKFARLAAPRRQPFMRGTRRSR